jgi:hypothetical protein
MLCDNGSPTGCNYMQCGPGRHAPLAPRNASKREETLRAQKARADDTAALGHDWIIEGTLAGAWLALDPATSGWPCRAVCCLLAAPRCSPLSAVCWLPPAAHPEIRRTETHLAGVLMQAELLLATRNVSGAQHFLPLFRKTSDFLETRRVQDASPLTPGAAGLFRAGNGANLLAPGYGGQGLPHGCLGNASCGTEGFPPCCTQRGMAYLTALTVTYSGVLTRLVALEQLAYPTGRTCTTPNANTLPITTCVQLYEARRSPPLSPPLSAAPQTTRASPQSPRPWRTETAPTSSKPSLLMASATACMRRRRHAPSTRRAHRSHGMATLRPPPMWTPSRFG